MTPTVPSEDPQPNPAQGDPRPLEPGVPSSEPVALDEPTTPRTPPEPKPDQGEPAAVSPTGVPTGAPLGSRAQHGEYLTTAGGSTPARHRPLAQGRAARSGAAARPSPAGEDHPLRPRAHPRARRPRAGRGRPRRVPLLRHRDPGDPRRVPGPGHRDPGLRPLLHGARLARVGRHGARHPRLRGEVLHRRGHVRPGGQQHARVLHPGRHQVPRRHPRRQTPSGPRDPAGPERPRHVLGLRVAAHRGAAPHHLEHVRPGDPALLPDDGGLRRPHLPAGQRGGRDLPGQVALEAGRRSALAGLGGGPAAERGGSRTSTGATSPTRSRPAPTPSGSWASRSSPTPRSRRSRGSTCSTPRRSSPRSWPRCSRSGG